MKKKLLTLLIATLSGIPFAYGENLLQVYQLALENDPQLRAARATRDSAFEAKPQAQAALRPNVSLSGNANHINSDVKGASGDTYNYNSSQLKLNLSQPIYHREYWIQQEQADKRVAQAEVQYSAEEQGLIFRVSQAYFDVLSAQDRLEFAKAQNAAIGRQLEQSKQRFEVGLIAITAVHEAQAAYDQSRADLIQAENTLDNSWETLWEITMTPVNTISPVIDELPLSRPEPESPEQWGEAAQKQNLSLQAAIYGVDITRQAIEVNRSGHYPTLDLVGGHAFDRTGSPSGSDADNTSIGLQLNVPLYAGGGVSSKVRQAQFDYEAAQENLDKQRRSVNRQVRNAYRGVIAGISSVEALKASTISAQSALEATEAGFEVGTRTMVDVLNAQRDLFQAMSNYATVRYNYVLSGLELKQAAGTLSEEDLVQVNSWLK
ncbi:MAG: type I secretion protein TolC [Sedimenticola sp.]|jgi:outer membrane protein|nr:MAG: type I secretion protein TolC [Sedimenticola sp.]